MADGKAAGESAAEALFFLDMPGHLVRRLHQRSVALFTREMAAAGIDITPIQFATLQAIAARGGLDQATLAAMVALDRVTIGGVVDRLVAKGLVSRRVSRRDRRARELRLTDAGAAMLARVIAVVERVQVLILDRLDDEERRRFLGLLAKAVEGETAGAEAPEPGADSRIPAAR
jgi:DNA-binding MarR family transcriptional regulator